MKALVPRPNDIRLAMIGSTPGNGHPYSWSAMFNGYDREIMTRECPYPGIPQYLNKEPAEKVPMAGARVTHVCCIGGGGFTAEHVAKCALIPHVVQDPLEVIGQVDAVVIATDIGSEHVARARPFIEAGLPVFIDKPLTDNAPDLKTFVDWVAAGKAILSSSSMRYAKEFLPYRLSTNDLGELRFVSITTSKSWETYGIHALESIYPILGPGFLSARNTGTAGRNIVHLKHRRGVDAIVVATADMYGGFGCLQLCGTAGKAQVALGDTFFAFKAQLAAFVEFLRAGVPPFPFTETVELMQLVIAGIRSREEGGREVALTEDPFMKTRSSRILKLLREGQLPTTLKINLSDPRVIEIAGLCGVDAVWLCNEHVPNDWLGIEGLIRAARVHNIDTLVRVAKGSYSDYVRPFEADATGIIVPHVASEEEARQIVQWVRFHPVGKRPLDGGNTDGQFCLIPLDEYLRHSNSERIVIFQIESPEALEEVEKIAAVPGFDGLLFGPGDFSHRIGKPGKLDDPQVVAARKRVAAVARRHGKFAMTSGLIAPLPDLFAEGHRVINLGADVVGIAGYVRQRLDLAQDLIGKLPPELKPAARSPYA